MCSARVQMYGAYSTHRRRVNGRRAVIGRRVVIGRQMTVGRRVTWRRRGRRMKRRRMETNYGYDPCVMSLEKANFRTQFSDVLPIQVHVLLM